MCGCMLRSECGDGKARSVMRSAEPEGAAETCAGGGHGVAGAAIVRIVQMVQVCADCAAQEWGKEKAGEGEGASEQVRSRAGCATQSRAGRWAMNKMPVSQCLAVAGSARTDVKYCTKHVCGNSTASKLES